MLKSFELKKDKDGWDLFDQLGDRVIKTRAEALADGTLENRIESGAVRIHREDSQIEEERTFPPSDPRNSPG